MNAHCYPLLVTSHLVKLCAKVRALTPDLLLFFVIPELFDTWMDLPDCESFSTFSSLIIYRHLIYIEFHFSFSFYFLRSFLR